MFLFSLIIIIYFLFIAANTCIWLLNKDFSFNKKEINNLSFATIIIPFKNEEKNILHCLESLLNQEGFNNNLFEIILVNDHSKDKSLNILNYKLNKINQNNIKVISLKDGFGKKAAIEQAIHIAKGDIIITSDADCYTPNRYWILSILNYFKNNKDCRLLICPVLFEGEKTFQKFCSLEFLSLTAMTSTLAMLKIPVLCNGANLAYYKKDFLTLNPYKDNKQILSGDDIFLLQKFKRKLKRKEIKFIKSNSAVILTQAPENFFSFFKQRIRWASKTKFYKDKESSILAFFILFVNIIIIVLFLLYLLKKIEFSYFLLFFAIKSIADFLYLFVIALYYKQVKLLSYFLIWSIFYPLYVVLIAIIINFTKENWK